MRGDTHVRFGSAAQRNGTAAMPSPRSGPTAQTHTHESARAERTARRLAEHVRPYLAEHVLEYVDSQAFVVMRPVGGAFYWSSEVASWPVLEGCGAQAVGDDDQGRECCEWVGGMGRRPCPPVRGLLWAVAECGCCQGERDGRNGGSGSSEQGASDKRHPCVQREVADGLSCELGLRAQIGECEGHDQCRQGHGGGCESSIASCDGAAGCHFDQWSTDVSGVQSDGGGKGARSISGTDADVAPPSCGRGRPVSPIDRATAQNAVVITARSGTRRRRSHQITRHTGPWPEWPCTTRSACGVSG